MTLGIKRISIAVIALVVIGALFIAVAPINAQDTSGSGLRISPTRTDISLVPGDSREVIQTVKNITQNSVRIVPTLNDFESDGLTGEPLLTGDPNDISAYSLRKFITLPEAFDLESGEERETTVILKVPENAAPGAYFGSVLYKASPVGSDGDGQVALLASVGSLVLLEVPGDITEKIEVKDISAYFDSKQGSIFTKKPDQIGVEIENLGNSFSQPFGKVLVKDWRGNEIFSYELNNGSPRRNVLPASTRLFSEELFDVETKSVNDEQVVEKTSPIKWPGKYTATGNISHGSTGEIYTVTSSFWYIPVWLVLSLVGVLTILVVSSVILYRKYVTKSTRRKK